MTLRIQQQHLSATNTRPSSATRPPGELWLNFPDLRFGMIDAARTAVDLLPIRVHAETSTYAAGDFVVRAGQLLQANAALPPEPFTSANWDIYQPLAQTDTRYLQLTGGIMLGPILLAGDPLTPLAAATKQYVDARGIGVFLPLSGGTLTGTLTLHADPFSALQAATKQYVDAHVGGVTGSFLPLSGGTLSGPLILAADPATHLEAATKQYVDAHTTTLPGGPFLPIAGGTLTGPLALNADPTAALQAATKRYVDTFLPLAGGVLTGALTLNADPTAALQAATKQYVDTHGGGTGTRVSVKTFGAHGDGVTDDTASIIACVAAVAAGAEIYFPIGRYLVSATISLTKNLTINGDGRLSTQILAVSPTLDVFSVTNAAVDIYDLGFGTASGVTRTAGAYVSFGTGSVRCRIDRFWMLNAFYGIRLTSGATADYFISDGEILNYSASGAGIRIDNGLAIQISSCVISQGAAPGAGFGVYITNCGDCDIVGCQIISAGNCLYCNPGAGQACSSVWATETFFDSSICGVHLNAAGGAIARCKFVSCWMATMTTQGISMHTSGGGTVGGIDFIACHIFGNASDGATIFDNNVYDIQFNACAVCGNSGYGIQGSTTQLWRVQSCRVGAAYGYPGNVAGGIYIGTGDSNYIIQGNELTGNGVAALLGPGLYSGTQYLVKDNIGWVTENFGNSSISSGATSVTVAHGLNSGGIAIGAYQILITPTSGQSPGNQLYVSSTAANTFTVSMIATAGSPITFSWNVHMYGAI